MWKTDDRALRVQVGAATVAARGRDVNQDTVIVAPGLFGVADGMGGPGGGDAASALAADAVVAAVAAGADGLAAASAAHDAVRAARSGVGLGRMGTTLCVGVVGWDDKTAAVQVVNVGDSRAYLLTPERQWCQLTRDQKYVQDLLDQGVISAAEAAVHPQRNVITSAVGHDVFEPDVQMIAVAPNARMVFCSDGVTDDLDGAALSALVGGRLHPQAVADGAVQEVAAAGARDDATIVVVDIVAVSGRARRAS
jgi:protein phosphatase